MSQVVQIPTELREDQGKGASRRLRREGWVPGILYGADRDPVNLQIPHKFLLRALQEESFYTSIMELKGKNAVQKVILRDIQRHPYKQQIMHVDFQRISDDEEVRMNIPLHFVNEDESPASKERGVVISHQINDVEVMALPKHLPEYIEVDLSELETGNIVTLADIKLPEGVTLTARDEELEAVVASANFVQVAAEPEEGEEVEADEVPTVGEDEGEAGEGEAQSEEGGEE